jgi:hypothetical protein
MGCPQVVKLGCITSSTLILNTGGTQECVLGPLLYSLYTHDCETAYGKEVGTLTAWCQVNNLSLNVSENKRS